MANRTEIESTHAEELLLNVEARGHELSVHDVIERDVIERVARRNRQIAELARANDQDLREWFARDNWENRSHEESNLDLDAYLRRRSGRAAQNASQ